jgi:hypothetical protein
MNLQTGCHNRFFIRFWIKETEATCLMFECIPARVFLSMCDNCHMPELKKHIFFRLYNSYFIQQWNVLVQNSQVQRFIYAYVYTVPPTGILKCLPLLSVLIWQMKRRELLTANTQVLQSNTLDTPDTIEHTFYHLNKGRNYNGYRSITSFHVRYKLEFKRYCCRHAVVLWVMTTCSRVGGCKEKIQAPSAVTRIRNCTEY